MFVNVYFVHFRSHRTSMGAVYSSYIRSSDVVYAENDCGVLETGKVESNMTCDNMQIDKSTRTGEQDSRLNAVSVTGRSVDIFHSANNTLFTTSKACAPAAATMSSCQGKDQHQPWFFANMTEEHWERLNMMCIVSPSSS